jgi:small subunit ribosomal protein S9
MPAKKKTTKKTSPKKKSAVKKPSTKKAPAKTVKKTAAEEPVKKAPAKEYLRTIGRRKRSIAQVRLFKNGKGEILINEKDYKVYFPVLSLQIMIKEPLKAAGQENNLDFSIKVTGGGIKGQAEAVRLGIARALVQLNPTLKKSLKKPGYLTRDPRKKERKKPGLKGARRAPQWSKR